MPCPYSDTPMPSPESFVARLHLLGKFEALVLADYIKERYPQLVFDVSWSYLTTTFQGPLLQASL